MCGVAKSGRAHIAHLCVAIKENIVLMCRRVGTVAIHPFIAGEIKPFSGGYDRRALRCLHYQLLAGSGPECGWVGLPSRQA